MKIGTNFPASAIGNDPIAIRDHVRAVEAAGYHHLRVIEHVTGAHPSRFEDVPFAFRPKNSGVTYTHETPWHEPLTLAAYLAGVTDTIEVTTCVLLLAQRQTVLVAKQVAEIDILSGRRFRLGIGIGWNFTEYEALGSDWSTRTERIEEQMEVLRLLWSQPLVDFRGRHHLLDQVGINPLPPQGPLPIFYASSARPVVLDRVARLADGWVPLLIPPEEPVSAVAELHAALERHGKDPAGFPMEASAAVSAPGMPVNQGGTRPANVPWQKQLLQWKELGATHFTLLVRARDAAETLDLALAVKAEADAEVGA